MFLDQNHYVGKAPVPLEQYRRYMQQVQQHGHREDHARPRTRRLSPISFSASRVLDQLGPAINAAHSMFVYGPPGNGKTVISSAIHGLLDGELAIPHALEVEGSIIRVFDPVNHEPMRRLTIATEWLTASGMISAGCGAAGRWSWSVAS